MSKLEFLTVKGYMPEQTGRFTIGERVIDYVESEAILARAVVLEGPPIYLWPNGNYASQHWSSPPFEIGWGLLNDLTGKIQGAHHFFLVDDINNRPPNLEDSHVEERLIAMADASRPIASSFLYNNSVDGIAVRKYRESEFVRKDSTNNCSTLDAAFQIEKILFYINQTGEGISIDNLRQLKLIVVHPSDFIEQQSSMLSSLLAEMKRQQFSKLTKSERRDFISTSYRHIWINGIGEVLGITRPIWNGDKFIFENIEV